MRGPHLREILQQFQQGGLTVQPKKCALAQTEVKYLGYLLGCEVICPRQGKVPVVKIQENLKFCLI